MELKQLYRINSKGTISPPCTVPLVRWDIYIYIIVVCLKSQVTHYKVVTTIVNTSFYSMYMYDRARATCIQHALSCDIT